MYLRNILRRNDDEVVKKVYDILKVNKDPGDLAVQVKEDLAKYDIELMNKESNPQSIDSARL